MRIDHTSHTEFLFEILWLEFTSDAVVVAVRIRFPNEGLVGFSAVEGAGPYVPEAEGCFAKRPTVL